MRKGEEEEEESNIMFDVYNHLILVCVSIQFKGASLAWETSANIAQTNNQKLFSLSFSHHHEDKGYGHEDVGDRHNTLVS